MKLINQENKKQRRIIKEKDDRKRDRLKKLEVVSPKKENKNLKDKMILQKKKYNLQIRNNVK